MDKGQNGESGHAGSASISAGRQTCLKQRLAACAACSKEKSCVLTAQKRQIPQDLTGFPNAPISCMADNKDDRQGEADSESADRQSQTCIRHCMQPVLPREEFC